MDWSNDNCPVCNSAAREALPRMSDFVEIICEDCGRYRITRSAMETVRHKEPAERQAMLQSAKNKAGGAMPIIMAI